MLRKITKRSSLAVMAAWLVLAAAGALAATPDPTVPPNMRKQEMRPEATRAPAVLEQVPADAKAVVVVNDIKALSTHVGNVAVRLNKNVPPDLAGYVTGMAGITKGFDFAGSAALVLLKDPKEAKEDKDDELIVGPPAMVLLLPTTDAKGLLEGMQPAEADQDGVMELTLPNATADKGYAATVGGEGKWVALTQDRDVLLNYLQHKESLAKSLPAETLQVFQANDLVVWASIPAVGAGVDKLLEDRQQEITGMMDLANLNNTKPESLAALEKGVVNELFAALKEYFKDAQAAMLTVRVRDAGVTLGLIGSFKADTPFGKFIAAQKPARALSLQGLPGGDVLLAAAAQWDGKSIGEALSGSVKRVMADQVIARDPRAADIQKLVDQYTQLLAMTSGMSVVLLDNAAEGKPGIMHGAALVETPEPGKYLALQAELWKNPVVKEYGSGNPDITEDFAVSPEAITVKGVKLTRIRMTWKLREETPEKPLNPGSQQALAVIEKMYGKDGMTFYTGEAGKRVVTIFGSDAATLEAAIAAAQANGNDLAGNGAVAGSKEQVVANTVGVMYFPVTRWLGMIQSMVPGMPPPPPPGPGLPAGQGGGGANAPPVVISAGVNGTTLTMEMYVPVPAIVAVKEAVEKVLGGGGMAPPGGEGGN